MGYKPKIGGTKYNGLIARGRDATREQCRLIADIIANGPNQAELFQMLTAVVLLTRQIDDVLFDLEGYRQEEK